MQQYESLVCCLLQRKEKFRDIQMQCFFETDVLCNSQPHITAFSNTEIEMDLGILPLIKFLNPLFNINTCYVLPTPSVQNKLIGHGVSFGGGSHFNQKNILCLYAYCFALVYKDKVILPVSFFESLLLFMLLTLFWNSQIMRIIFES